MSADAKKKSKKSKKTGDTPVTQTDAQSPAQDAAAGEPDAPPTNLESSVRLSEDARQKYEEMAEEGKTQKTSVLEHAIHSLAATVAKNPTEFQGAKRPWTNPSAD